MRKKIFIVGSNGVPARYGGFETFAEQFARHNSHLFDITVFCSSHFYPKEEQQSNWKGINRKFIPQRANGPLGILYDIKALFSARKSSDIIIMLGIGAGFALFFLPIHIRRKVWLHPDGVEYKRKKWGPIAKLYLYFNWRISIRLAGKIILDSPALLRLIPKQLQNKVISSGYGADHLPLKVPHPDIPPGFALGIARAEPDNNLEMIIEGFLSSQLKSLVIISNWSNTKYGRRIQKKYANEKRLVLGGPVYDASKLQQFRAHCNLYIHGHSAGGTNPSLVEAMYSGAPVFALATPYNKATTHNQANYFDSAKMLAACLTSASTEQLHEMGKQMREIAQKNYTWEIALRNLVENTAYDN